LQKEVRIRLFYSGFSRGRNVVSKGPVGFYPPGNSMEDSCFAEGVALSR